MKIEIEYNGSIAKCKVTPFENPFGDMVNFNDADRMTQVFALGAFDCIKHHWKREMKNKQSTNRTYTLFDLKKSENG